MRISLWTMHVTDRLSGPNGPGPFAGEPWWEYMPTILAQALPWTPIAVLGAYRSLGRALVCRNLFPRPASVLSSPSSLPRSKIGDRLLWVWTAVPLALLSIPSVKNAHYAIAAQVPWSIWAAFALREIGERLRRRGWSRPRLRLAACSGFASLALVWGLSLWLIAPRLDPRGNGVGLLRVKSAARSLPQRRSRFSTTTGTVCPTRARSARFRTTWPFDSSTLAAQPAGTGVLNRSPTTTTRNAARRAPHSGRTTAARRLPTRTPSSPFWAESSDLPELEHLGHVETVARGPTLREDRVYSLFRIAKSTEESQLARRPDGDGNAPR